MKKTILVFIISGLVIRANASEFIELGKASVVGTACASIISEPKVEEGRLQLPIGLNLKKTPAESLKRGTCNLVLPITVAEGHRLVLSNTLSEGLVNLRKGGASKIQLEVFKAGEHGEILVAQHDATQKKVREAVELRSEGDVIATQCGEPINLRANMSAILNGTNRSTARMDQVELELRVEECQ